MSITKVETFYPVDIKNVNLKFKGESETAINFGCTAVLSGETEMRTVQATCGGVVLHEKSKPIRMTGTISGHAKVEVLRKYFGLKNDGLKKGVYSYGLDSQGGDFTLTADVIDDFQDFLKVMAFPNGANITGFTFSIDKSNDEVAPVELSFVAKPDEAGKFYYEAYASELEEGLIESWRTNFSYDLVKVETP